MSKKNEILERKDVLTEDTWDLESMFKDVAEWEASLKEVEEKALDFLKYQGKVIDSSESLFNALADYGELMRLAMKVYSYSSMNLDQDTRVASSQELSAKAMSLIVGIQEKTSFMTPEILKLENETLEAYYKEKEELELYRQYLDNIIRGKKACIIS